MRDGTAKINNAKLWVCTYDSEAVIRVACEKEFKTVVARFRFDEQCVHPAHNSDSAVDTTGCTIGYVTLLRH